MGQSLLNTSQVMAPASRPAHILHVAINLRWTACLPGLKERKKEMRQELSLVAWINKPSQRHEAWGGARPDSMASRLFPGVWPPCIAIAIAPVCDLSVFPPNAHVLRRRSLSFRKQYYHLLLASG